LAIGGGVLLLAGTATAIYFFTRDKPVTPVEKREDFPGIMAHWSFDGADAATDVSGRGNGGTLNAGTFASGKKGKAMSFGGRDDQFIDLGTGKDLNFKHDEAFTVAAWFQTSEKVGTILSLRHTTLPGQINLFVRDNHALGIVGDDTDDGKGAGRHAFCWCHPLNDGQWHHVALMRYENFIEIYYDGQSQGKDTHGACRSKITTNLRTIGCERKFVQEDERRFGRAGFKGSVDEVYVLNRWLKAEEVLALMKR